MQINYGQNLFLHFQEVGSRDAICFKVKVLFEKEGTINFKFSRLCKIYFATLY